MIDKMFNQKGFSLYSQKFVLFMSKLIPWTILKGIKNEQKALEFLDVLIEVNEEAKRAYEIIMSGENYDDELVKAYFANALKQYSDYLNLGWEVETEHEFVSFEEAELMKIASELGDM